MIEMIVVIAIILVLIGMAAGRYEKSIVRSREAVLKQDLATMRNAIQQYTLDKGAGAPVAGRPGFRRLLARSAHRPDHPRARLAYQFR